MNTFAQRAVASTQATSDQIDKARKMYGSDDVEIDDDAIISGEAPDSEQEGIWVSAWVWVPADA